MDVCTVPFLVNEHTRTMSPLKILEYLAAGKPVVSTPLPALRAYGPHVALASGAEEFAAAVELALAEDSEARRRSRAEFAGRHSWESRLEEICGLVEMTAALKGVGTKDRDARRVRNRVAGEAGRSQRSGGGADVTPAVAVKSTTGRSPDRPGNGAAPRLREDSRIRPLANSYRGMAVLRRAAPVRGSPPSRRPNEARMAGWSVQIGSVPPSGETDRGALRSDRSHRGEEIETTRQRSGSEIPP